MTKCVVGVVVVFIMFTLLALHLVGGDAPGYGGGGVGCCWSTALPAGRIN